MKCIKCESKNLQIVVSGPHKKLVCTDCFAFQKFLSKTEVKTFEQLQNKPHKPPFKCPHCGLEHPLRRLASFCCR